MTHILGVSSPRSGHHLFEAILRDIFAENYKYCEYYSPVDCCHKVPCSSADSKKYIEDGIFFQKSHDFMFSDPIYVEGTYRLIQIRDPIPRAFSDYRLYIKARNLVDSEDSFKSFLEYEAHYFILFYKKWILGRTTPAFVLTYERLVEDTLAAIYDFLKFCGLESDLDRISESVIKVTGKFADAPAPFVRSEVSSHKYASSKWCGEYERVVFKHCGGFSGKRYFSVAGDYFDENTALFENAALNWKTNNLT